MGWWCKVIGVFGKNVNGNFLGVAVFLFNDDVDTF